MRARAVSVETLSVIPNPPSMRSSAAMQQTTAWLEMPGRLNAAAGGRPIRRSPRLSRLQRSWALE